MTPYRGSFCFGEPPFGPWSLLTLAKITAFSFCCRGCRRISTKDSHKQRWSENAILSPHFCLFDHFLNDFLFIFSYFFLKKIWKIDQMHISTRKINTFLQKIALKINSCQSFTNSTSQCSLQGWVVNMVPWLALPPCTFLGKYITDYLIARDWPVTRVRKIVQSCCFLSENIALLIMCRTKNFYTALTCMTIVIGTCC